MNHEPWKPIWVRGSKIEDIIWIGKDVLAWCSGVHIIFFNIVRKEQSIRWCWNQELGEGASCLSAHSTLSVFAFVEKVLQPRILIFAYPSMKKISECAGGCPSGYLATAFTARDQVVSIGSYPYFPLTVWNWRTGERIITVNTSIRDEVGQILRITQTGPTVIAQMGKTCGKLFTWELDISGKVVILKDHEVKLSKNAEVLWVDWCPTSTEPLLAITDRDGHVFLSNYDGSNIHRIVLSQRCGVCVDVELPMVCWFRDGIVLRTTFCQIRFFRRNPRTSKWKREWYVKSITRPSILVTHPFNSKWLFYHTLEGFLMHVDYLEEDETPNVNKYLELGAVYRFADFVYPWCHHIITTNNLKELIVLECYSGSHIATIDLETDGEISCQASHPNYPLIVLANTRGEAIFLSLVNPEESRVVACLKLQRQPLDLIKFSYTGRSVVVAEKASGNCYCINLHTDKPYNVEALVSVQKSIADLLIYEAQRSLKVLVLYAGVKQFSVGQRLYVFDVPNTQNLVAQISYVLDLPGVYRNLSHVPGNPMLLVGSPYCTRQLRVQKVVDFKDTTIVNSLMSEHQVRLANLFVDRHWIASTAFDGLVIVRDKSVKNIRGCVMSHHRSDFGSVKAMVSGHGDLIVSLGYNGSLVAISSNRGDKKENTNSTPDQAKANYRVDRTVYEKLESKIQSDYSSLDPTVSGLLTCSKIEIPGPEEGDKTWTEWREEMQILEEKAACENDRQAILQDFEVLRVKVKILLDANEICPDIEKLPISAFDLDKAGRDQKLKAGRDECENIHLELEHKASEMNRVSAWIRETFWDHQKVVGKSLFAILGSMEVTNYPSVAEDPDTKDHLQWAVFCKETLRKIMKNDTFQPWRMYTDEELQVELSKRVKLFHEEHARIDLIFDEEEVDKEFVEEELERQRAIEGTLSFQYIEPSPCYNQIESYGFGHVILNNHLLMHDCEKLRTYFNQSFDEVYALKEREMNVIRDRIGRIRRIDSELNTMFGQRVPSVPADPEWHMQERPETIITVQDHEVKAKPYVSPSKQEILDKQAAEEERIRQLLLADDFRERALMAMMNGVLEVRWEDTIKIDVPKPACMIEKKPEDYTAEDIQAVKQYEKDVQFLTEERQRYKRMLEAEYTKVVGLLQEGINRFNGKLEELFHLKMSVESAIIQLQLRYIRGCLRNYRRMKSLQLEDKIRKQIAESQEYEEVLKAQLQTFQNVHHDLLTQYETLCNREKATTKKLKGDFPFLSKLNAELLERQCRRRPRTHLKNLSASNFLELANHVLARTQANYLPLDCKDYLRALDHLDSRPSTLPVSIDNANWDQLIKLRRQKISLELKIKSKEAELADMELVLLRFEQKIEKCRNDAEEANRKIMNIRKHRTLSDLNIEIQLVVKMGQVETDITGDLTDTENAILIPRSEIESVNELIRAAGACKLDALSRLLNFQRGTLLKEWEHECKRKQVQDLEDDLRFTESVTVTKEMQQYLKRKAKGLEDDKTLMLLNEDVDVIKRRFDEILATQQAKLQSIEKEIAIIRSKNEQFDRKIFEMNVERCEMELRRDTIGEARQREHMERKIRMVMRRSDLIKKLQDNYARLLELQTEHELLRLRRYPTFHFKTLHDKSTEKKSSKTKLNICPC